MRTLSTWLGQKFILAKISPKDFLEIMKVGSLMDQNQEVLSPKSQCLMA
jgi:hypothetical protein